MKSEPDVFSIDDLIQRGVENWDGVRNYQARNFMRDHMKVGAQVLFYHSNTAQPGIYGLARVTGAPVPDKTSIDIGHKGFDPKASVDNPIWCMVEVGQGVKFFKPVLLSQIRNDPTLSEMLVARKGQRLSIQPVSQAEFRQVLKLAGYKHDQ